MTKPHASVAILLSFFTNAVPSFAQPLHLAEKTHHPVGPLFYSTKHQTHSWFVKDHEGKLLLKRNRSDQNLPEIKVAAPTFDFRHLEPKITNDGSTLVFKGHGSQLVSINLETGQQKVHIPTLEQVGYNGTKTTQALQAPVYSFEPSSDPKNPNQVHVSFLGRPGFMNLDLKTDLLNSGSKTGFTPARITKVYPGGAVVVESPLSHEARADLEVVHYASPGPGLRETPSVRWRHEIHGLKKGVPIMDSPSKIYVNATTQKGQSTVTILTGYHGETPRQLVEVLDLESGHVLRSTTYETTPEKVAVNDKGTQIALATSAGILVLDTVTGKEVQTLKTADSFDINASSIFWQDSEWIVIQNEEAQVFPAALEP